jgi:hypothetical protein
MRYTSREEVPDRFLALEHPPLSDVERIWREPRTRIRCGSCDRYYLARTSENPRCEDCRFGKTARSLPTVDTSGDQTISAAR